MNTGQITDPLLHIVPSAALYSYITSGIDVTHDVSPGIACILLKTESSKEFIKKHSECLLITDKNCDQSTISTGLLLTEPVTEAINIDKNEKLLDLQDLHWLSEHIQNENVKNESRNEAKVYLHELLEGSRVLLPRNAEISRNSKLEERCQKLKASQENVEYNRMTKDLDGVEKKYPEDSLGYQIQQMNRHLVAIFQFIMSVMAGFAFGFVGIELIVGNLDVGFRLLLGIIFSLIIALAELYFLAKRLNEDWPLPKKS